MLADAKNSADCEGSAVEEDNDLLLSAECKKLLDSTSTEIKNIR